MLLLHHILLHERGGRASDITLFYSFVSRCSNGFKEWIQWIRRLDPLDLMANASKEWIHWIQKVYSNPINPTCPRPSPSPSLVPPSTKSLHQHLHHFPPPNPSIKSLRQIPPPTPLPLPSTKSFHPIPPPTLPLFPSAKSLHQRLHHLLPPDPFTKSLHQRPHHFPPVLVTNASTISLHYFPPPYPSTNASTISHHIPPHLLGSFMLDVKWSKITQSVAHRSRLLTTKQ
jgi:hypothetical protein